MMTVGGYPYDETEIPHVIPPGLSPGFSHRFPRLGQDIYFQTGCKIRVRGRGSGHLDRWL